MSGQRGAWPVRSVGVEEELLLVDPASGQPRSLAAQVVKVAAESTSSPEEGEGEGGVEGELQRYMVEIQSSPRTDLAEVERELRQYRHAVAHAARGVGAAAAALGTSPLPVAGIITANERYQRMAERFGVTAMEVLTCGCHVHVGVESDDEGVAVLDRIRVWLPVLLGLSANSPFVGGRDSGYASYRSQMWVRWPSAGPTERFGTAARYAELVRAMTESGVLLDDGMVYFDARLSRRYPTVEIRVGDVCGTVEDATVLAALCRGLVDTASEAAARGEPAPDLPVPLLRLASWRAGHDGAEGTLLDPLTARPRPAEEVVRSLLEHVSPALERSGDLERVTVGLDRLVAEGTAAARQRRTYARTGSLVDVVAEASRLTLAI